MRHFCFLFDYRSFRENNSELFSDLTRGDTHRLKKHVDAIRSNISSKDRWILEGKGANIEASEFEIDKKFRNAKIGYWLLIVLSQYLEPLPSLNFEWRKLYSFLLSTGMSDDDVEELIFGDPVSSILHPSKIRKNNLAWSDPYWMWLRLDRSPYNGWHSIEQVRYASIKLEKISQNLSIDPPFSLEGLNNNEYLTLIGMMRDNYKNAIYRNLGLFSGCPDDK
jgi:hypothetical protein